MYVSISKHLGYVSMRVNMDKDDGECWVHNVSFSMKLTRDEAATLCNQLNKYLVEVADRLAQEEKEDKDYHPFGMIDAEYPKERP